HTIVEARNFHPAAGVVHGSADAGEDAYRIDRQTAVNAGMKIARRAADNDLGCRQAAQHRRDGRSIAVPLSRVADEGQISGNFLAVLLQEAWKRWRTAFLFAFDQ